MRAVSWVSTLLHHCPRLTKLHWDGPSGLHAPWAQLTHLSWGVGHAEREFFERTLDQLLQLEYLRLAVTDDPEMWDQTTPLHKLQRVTTLSLQATAPTRFLILPQLHHLILESRLDFDPDLVRLLHRSQCNISILELWTDDSLEWVPDALPLPFHHPAIHLTLTRLVITSFDLNELFLVFEERSPGSLPSKIRLLCGPDRCFQIEDLPEITLKSTSGVLAGLILKHFRGMEMLELDEHLPHSPSNPPELEHHTVLVGTSQTLVVSRHAAFRREYQAWWISADGREFRAALDAEDEALLQSFELPVDFMKHGHFPWGKAAGQNLFANTRWPGYVFV
ncbi:hypothetical protein B0H14DRAFT_3496020 [Mycena olivaceomarginata]|nr:hypothetical protein B0H14DRAFT_3496020 [Mycena olivaceomarginata]